jgi:molecular chaperone GrpE
MKEENNLKTEGSNEKNLKKNHTIKKNKIEDLELELKEAKEDLLRARADYENLRKRTLNELEEARDRAIGSFVADILPAIDNFEMSLKMSDNKEMFIKGVEMIHKNLIDILKEKNIEAYEVEEGSDFNPHEHDPILIEDDSKKPGIIVNTIKKGYKFKSTILRPARVEVVKEKENKNE